MSHIIVVYSMMRTSGSQNFLNKPDSPPLGSLWNGTFVSFHKCRHKSFLNLLHRNAYLLDEQREETKLVKETKVQKLALPHFKYIVTQGLRL